MLVLIGSASYERDRLASQSFAMLHAYSDSPDETGPDYQPRTMSSAIFSPRASKGENISTTQSPTKHEYSQIRDCGCPGGKNGNEDASTTLRPCTPYTRAFESMTAIELSRVPIAPGHRINQLYTPQRKRKDVSLTSTRSMVHGRYAPSDIFLQFGISRHVIASIERSTFQEHPSHFPTQTPQIN